MEPLWIAALGAQFIVLGWWFIPRFIRLLGRGGAVETVEWAVWMSTLVLFPPAVWLVGYVIPRLASESAASGVRLALVILAMVEFAAYAVFKSSHPLVIAALAAAFAGVVLAARRSDRATLMLMIACGMAGWMAAGGLVYWESALKWLTDSPWTVVALVISVILVGGLMRAWVNDNGGASRGARILDLAAVAALVAFSFRTYPVVEFFHWGFFVGPIDQLRDGGTLLWDTPSQYGFLSILLPALLPGSAWQSFWFFQALTYSVVAVLLYFAIRRLADRWWSAAAAFAITLIVLFFRPRSASLLLPAQMTPAAGPFRFIWCFVLLAFLVRWYTGPKRDDTARFMIAGTQVWAISLLWSAESAIYVTAMWFPALVIRALQAASERGPGSTRGAPGSILSAAAFTAAILIITAGAVVLTYRLAFGFGPDMLAYVDYVLLYSRGGFGALPIDPTGIVWYLVILFLMVSTILGLHAIRDRRDPRLAVWAAAWGCVWSLASYFTGRSHPVNLIAIAPVLIFALVACMRLRPFDGSASARLAMAAAILPLLAMPVTLTAGHASFAKAVTEPQLPPSRFIEQVDLMDPSLQSLLVTAGAKPADSFVLVGDGRLMLPAWSTSGLPTAVGNPVTTRVWSTRSWLPKAFEIVGSLPEGRRQAYFDRNAASFRDPGWLIQSRTLTANGADHFLRFVQSSRQEIRRFENDKWIVSWMGPAIRSPD